MTENDYIGVQQLTRVSAAKEMLSYLMPKSFPNDGTRYQFTEAYSLLCQVEESLMTRLIAGGFDPS